MALMRSFFFLILIGFSSLHAVTQSPFTVFLISDTELYSYRIDPAANPPTATLASVSGIAYTQAIGVTVSPDEAHVYVLDNSTSPALHSYQITPSTGAFAFNHTYTGVAATQSGYDGYINPLAVHPNDRFVYIPDYNQNCINVLDTETLILSTRQFMSGTIGGEASDLTQPVSVAVSALGTYLGIGGALSNPFFPAWLFRLDPTTGLQLAGSGGGAFYGGPGTSVGDPGTDATVVFSTTGQTIVTVGVTGGGGTFNACAVPVANPTGGASILAGADGPLWGAPAFVPNSETNVYIAYKNTTGVDDVTMVPPYPSVMSLLSSATLSNIAFSPDGLTLCGYSGNHLYIWTSWTDTYSLLSARIDLEVAYTIVGLAVAPPPLSTAVVGQNPATTRN